jgi:FkbM family methyltransferase
MNIGFFSLLAARIVGNDGRVIVIVSGANPEIASRLPVQDSRNNFAGIPLRKRPRGLNPAPFFAPTDRATSPGRELSQIVANDAIQANTVSPDEYVRNDRAPNFLKCDVEGAQVEAFRGAHQMFREKRPTNSREIRSDENR